ncbi:MAG: hypothetical protein ABI411_02065 [Tahibacter sp.]
MKFIPTRKQWPILGALILLMLLTRYHHLWSALNLPDASMAVFFAAGFYLAGSAALPLLMLEAGLIDYVAITQAGVSDFCVTPAYSVLILAYAVLWYAGGAYAKHYRPALSTLAPLVVAALGGCLLSFVLSNGAFYWIGGRYPDPNFSEFVQRFMQYAPSFIAVAMAWIAVLAVMHGVWVRAFHSSESRTSASR